VPTPRSPSTAASGAAEGSALGRPGAVGFGVRPRRARKARATRRQPQADVGGACAERAEKCA
jgi:hypothetical protein